ncbi:hypothetical protein PYW07_012424 [Mythimna separata]|uniref:Uncharacterized protein n=1 Tax=Mythimna separata TaxID=271217 RepID=A0AAD7YL58_MYTSE|nr:hypothetical protein PYW07_012424 [Mythimna separata]
MFDRKFVWIIILVLYGVYCFDGITVVPERALLKYVNEKYVSNVSVGVRRSTKRGEYVFNVKLINKTAVGNNVTFHLVIYELSTRYNQYVRTLMEFHYKWCDLVLRDMWFGPILRKYGLTECPTPPGPIAISNMTFSGKFPFVVLFDKGKLEATWTVGPSGEVMGCLEVFVGLGKP